MGSRKLLRARNNDVTLVAALEHKHPSVRYRAVLRCGGSDDLRILERLTELLRDPDQKVRDAALAALDGVNKASIVRLLAVMLQDEDQDPLPIITALGHAEYPEAQLRLLKLVSSPNKRLSEPAARALQGTTNPIVCGTLLKLMLESDPTRADCAALALRGTQHHQTVLSLLQLLQLAKTEEDKVRAARALSGSTVPHAVNVFKELIETAHIGIRITAIRTAGPFLELSQVEKHCRTWLDDSSEEVKRAGIEAVSNRDSRICIRALLHLAQREPNNELRALAINALSPNLRKDDYGALELILLNDQASEVRFAAVKHFRADLHEKILTHVIWHDPNTKLKAAAVTQLSGSHSTFARELMRRICADPVWRSKEVPVRIASVRFLSRDASIENIEALRQALRTDPSEVVRAEALKALNTLSKGLETDELLTLIGSPALEVRLEALHAIGKLRLRKANQLLVPLLRDTEPEIRRAAADALQHTKDPETATFLIHFMEGEDSELRFLCANALKGVREPDVVKKLNILCSSPKPQIRLAAITALSETPQSLVRDTLAQALKDEVGTVRFEAQKILQSPAFAVWNTPRR